MNRMIQRLAWVAALLLATAGAQAQEHPRIMAVPTARDGVTQPVLFVTPAQPWDTAVILFVGRGGQADVETHGTDGRGQNTLYRGLDILVREGVAAAVVDPPSDRPSLWNYRNTADHADDIAHVIAALKQGGAKRVWLAGISMGTLSAASIAQRLKTGGPDGIVMMSSIVNPNRESSETVLQIPLEEIAVPVLLIRNPGDGCRSSPPEGADRILRQLDGAPVKRLMEFGGGGSSRGGPCEALSAHGFIGQDEPLMTAVAGWIKNPN